MFKKSGKVAAKLKQEDNYVQIKNSSEGNTETPSKDGGVLKTGYAIKLKTMKKKFFVLLSANETRNAKLCYYDNEKKWTNNTQAKRAIIIKDCFVINRPKDSKYDYVITLYTTEDFFSIVFDTENEMQDWLQLLIDVWKNNRPFDSEPLPSFEYIWQVTIKNKDLGSSKKITGQYHVCLSGQALFLIKLGVIHTPENSMEFPLLSIRRCGHSESVFFVEMGRSALTGAGELWMQTEGTETAQKMHETILSSMKSCRSMEENVSGKTTRSRRSSNTKSYKNESAFPIARSVSTSSRPDNILESSAFRHRTVSEGQHSLLKERLKRLESFNEGNSPEIFDSKTKSLSTDLFPRSSTSSSPAYDSLLSDDLKLDLLHSIHSLSSSLQMTKETICEESESTDDYLAMDPSEDIVESEYLDTNPSASTPETLESPLSKSLEVEKSSGISIPREDEPYVDMNSPPCSTDGNDGYLSMSCGKSYKGSSVCSSMNTSMVSNDGGYPITTGKSPCEFNRSGFHLDKVHSYISNLCDYGTMPPIRSYSVGAAAKSNLQLDQNYRTRALSCGSRDDTSKLKRRHLKSRVVSQLSSEHDDEKSTSAPHLSGQKPHTYGGSRQEDLMELEFTPDMISNPCSQSSSHSSLNSRSRSGSKSSSSRLKSPGAKRSSCDHCEQPLSTCNCFNIPTTSLSVDYPSRVVLSFPFSNLEKPTIKMSPSQELVQQHLNAFNLKNQDDDGSSSFKDRSSESKLQSKVEPGDYINIDYAYMKPGSANLTKDAENKRAIIPKESNGDDRNISLELKETIEITNCGFSQVEKAVVKNHSISPILPDNQKLAVQDKFGPNDSSRPSSIGSELELNYASLDLAPSAEGDDSQLDSNNSPQSTASQNSNVVCNTSSEDIKPIAMSYAKIDFTISEGLRQSTTISHAAESRH